MKSFSVFAFILILLNTVSVQKLFSQISDHKSQSLSTPANSKNKADSLLLLGIQAQDRGDFKGSLFFLEKSRVIYQNLNSLKEVGDCYSLTATTYYYQGDYSKALLIFQQSIFSYNKIGYKKGVASVLNNMGGVYYYLGNYPQALEFYKKSIQIQEAIGDDKIIAATTQNIGGIYDKVNDYPNAMIYYKKAYDIYIKINDRKLIAQNLNSTGSLYRKQKYYAKSFEILNKALQIATKIGVKQIQMEVLLNLGELFYDQDELLKALEHYKRCLEFAKDINSVQYISDAEIAIGKILQRLGNSREAIIRCSRGLKLAEELQSLPAKKEACRCLYEAHKSSGNMRVALMYFENYLSLNDSLRSEETTGSIMKMEFQKQTLLDSLFQVKKDHTIKLKHNEEIQNRERQRNYIIATLCFILLISAGLWNRLYYVRKSRTAIKLEKDNSERLLRNILPVEIADELKANGCVSAKNFSSVSILFTDFKSFTETAEKLTPQELVQEINVCFKAFDLICEKYNVEKIKTIGDAYMAASGIPKPDEKFLINIVAAGLEMQKFMIERKLSNDEAGIPAFEMRVGIHAGPVVAGIVGVRKFQYDVWGDTVNTASRMESCGQVNMVNISESLYELIKDERQFSFNYRGMIQAKGKGEIKMYFVDY